MTAASNDQEFYQTYMEKIIDEDDEIDNELIESIKHDFDVEEDVSEAVEDGQDKGNIIIDTDGIYYIQTSEKMVKIEPLSKVSKTAAKTLAAIKKEAQPDTAHAKNRKLEPNSGENVRDEEKSMDETTSSEVSKQQEIYEFDENEQGANDSCEDGEIKYKYKHVIKKVDKGAATDSATFPCLICEYRTTKKFLLSRHLKTHSDERPYKCSVCERGFKTNASLMNHRNTHLGLKPHACQDCDMAFATSGELVRHVRYRHTHEKPHKCTECDYSSVELSKLRRHMRCHTGERPYQCPHCTYASPDTFKLKRHMRIHTGEKPYECDICKARFTQSNSLKHHRLIHSVNDKPVFQCHLCPTTCGRKTDLRLHIKKLHNSDQPLPCKRCGKQLPDRYSYKMHIKTHEGEKCYRCEYCPYASISKRHLESHVFIHLNAKPFECEVCKTTFRQKTLLSRHIKVYHSDNYEPPQPRKKDHKCPHCKKMFAFNGNLIRHMEIHDPTSRLFEKKQELKEGRMKRVLEDGTVVTAQPLNSLSKVLERNTEHSDKAQESKVQDEKPQENVNDEEVEYNEDNIQYVFDELEENDECDEENESNESFEEEYEPEPENNRKNIVDIKMETVVAGTPLPVLKQSLNVKSENDHETLSLELQDDQGFMVIEVLPDEDEEEEEVKGQQQKVHLQQPVRSFIINSKINKSNKKQTNKDESQSLISDYFMFEVDEDDDDEETNEAIKLLQMIKHE